MNAEDLLERLVSTGIVRPAAGTDDAYRTNAELETDSILEDFVRLGLLTPYQVDVIRSGRLNDLVLGDYIIRDELGRGGMGVVYRAWHRLMDRDVALKILPTSATERSAAFERFRREVRAAARLKHPNVVACFDARKEGQRHFFAMEWIDGKDFARIVRDEGPLSVELAIDCVEQAARGLAYAHAEGIIHRDVKPSNLMRCADGTVKVLDFGLASLRSHQAAGLESGVALTETGQAMGTYDYMSPEQANDATKADERSDIYSLGCTLHFLIAGRPPFAAATPMQKALAHRDTPIPPLNSAQGEVPQKLSQLFTAMLAKDPNGRPAQMAQVADELSSVLSSLRNRQYADTVGLGDDSAPTPGGPEPTLAPGQSTRSWWPAMTTIVSIVSLVAASIAISLFILRDTADPQDEVPTTTSEPPQTALVAPVFFTDFDGEPKHNKGRGRENGVFYIEAKPRTGWVWNQKKIRVDGIVGASFRICEDSLGAAVVSIWCDKSTQAFYVDFFNNGKMEIRGDLLAGSIDRSKPTIGPLQVDEMRPIGQYNQLYMLIQGDQFWVYLNSKLIVGPVKTVRDMCPATLRFGARGEPPKGSRVEFDDLAVWPTTDIHALAMPTDPARRVQVVDD